MEFANLMKLICFMASLDGGGVELISGQLYYTSPPSKLDGLIGRDYLGKIISAS